MGSKRAKRLKVSGEPSNGTEILAFLLVFSTTYVLTASLKINQKKIRL